MATTRIGIWLIGAKGGVAATTIVGLAGLRRGLVAETGLVSALPQFARLDLPAWTDFVIGGHDIRDAALAGEARRLVDESHTVSPELLEGCREEIDAIESRIRPGTLIGCGPTIAALASDETPRDEAPYEALARVGHDLADFARQERLEHIVVVNVASTEPPVPAAGLPARWLDLERTIGPGRGGCPLPASTLYAIAAMQAGCSYVNFTPSLGSAPAALDELARLSETRHYGCDGKTGETLLKSVLAPMFERRNLRVLSWVGHNIFGNMDGRVLADPANKQTKLASKDHLVGDILGYRPQTHVSIEFIESLGDWKTAWDHVHFAGFLDVPMVLQFIWQGCDSVLAAPLVLDLVRFTEAARRRGHTGAMPFLASFFKSPYGVEEQRFDRQFRMLEHWSQSAN